MNKNTNYQSDKDSSIKTVYQYDLTPKNPTWDEYVGIGGIILFILFVVLARIIADTGTIQRIANFSLSIGLVSLAYGPLARPIRYSEIVEARCEAITSERHTGKNRETEDKVLLAYSYQGQTYRSVAEDTEMRSHIYEGEVTSIYIWPKHPDRCLTRLYTGYVIGIVVAIMGIGLAIRTIMFI